MDKPIPGNKATVELDKVKRRLIRSVARLLLQDKLTEEEIWKQLRNETGCDCEILWTRMRALTVKKLNRLLLANDRMDAVPRAGRMSFTDWLMFDLVLVHQKIDLIGQNMPQTKDFPALVELFELVKMFDLENLRGDELAEAWSLATLNYNNRGHHCSPMLLQRRWYQLKEVTRTKFYEYWYAYRGSAQRITLSEPYKPSPLQTEIARTFKILIIQPLEKWEELIEKRLVTMPDEFERRMKEILVQKRPAAAQKTNDDVPDLVMIEQRLETIDLRLEPDGDETEENKQEGVLVPPEVPIVKVKQEPLDDIEDVDEPQVQLPKKSIYEVVLESTALENEQIDSMDAEDLVSECEDQEGEETPARDEAESALPQIASVFGNVSDTSVLTSIDEDKVCVNTEGFGNDDVSNIEVDQTYYNNHKNTDKVSETVVLNDVQDTARNNGKESYASNVENCVENNDQAIKIVEKETVVDISDTVEEIRDNIGETNQAGGNSNNIHEVVNVSSDDDEGKAGATLTGKVDKIVDVIEQVDSEGLNISETNVTSSADKTCLSENIEETSEPVARESVAVLDAKNTSTEVAALSVPTTNITVTESPTNDVEIVESGDPIVIINSDDEDNDAVKGLVKTVSNSTLEDKINHGSIIEQPIEVLSSSEILKVDLKGGAVSSVEDGVRDVKPDISSFNFGELPNDISFADEGIEFVDDGIAYMDEDGDTEPQVKREVDDEDSPKIDAKLLMCPIVYTTRLDDMYLFHRQPFLPIKDKNLLDYIAKKSKPIKQEPKETVENVTVNYVGENIESVTVNATRIEHVHKNVMTIEKVSVNNDSIEIIKKEPVDIISETAADVENNLEIEEDVSSDEDDSDKNTIDESQKVKPTSYLLQKPRSRKYNPIQLCKNPDFNTRLKRLSVGFFSSPRNRLLIKSCKPLTIDLSKAFESKLVSGTLYLKPVDHNVVTEIIDDTESRNVSVIPSAMPAQSLIDNSKVTDILPMLLQSSVTSIQPQDESASIERNKIINLPDITEIRRINQRLLTAEVTPIQVHNNKCQVPVTIVTSLNSPTCFSQKTTTTHDARGPPKLLDITDDYPAQITDQYQPTTTYGNNTHRLTGRNTIDTSRHQTQPLVAGQPQRMQNVKKMIPLKPPVERWKSRQHRLEIPWFSKSNEVSINVMNNETLLTLDALNKMLFLLTKKVQPEELAKKLKCKGKRKNSTQQMNQNRPQSTSDDPGVILVPANLDKASESQNVCTKKPMKQPKLTVKAATNYPSDKEKTDDTVSHLPNKKVTYCCWARQRMLQLLFSRKRIPVHSCPRLCICCCRHLLAEYITHEQKIKNAEMQKMRAAVNPYRITKESVASENAMISENLREPCIENPVKTPAEVLAVENVAEETPVVNVDFTITDSTSNTSMENEPIAIEDIEDGVLAVGGEVSVETIAEVATPALLGLAASHTVKGTVVAVPIVKNHTTPEVGKSLLVTRVTSDEQSGGLKSIKTTKTSSTTIDTNITSPPSLSQFLAVRKTRETKKIKSKLPPPPTFIKPSVSPKAFKEKMIYLNSKQISEKPTASPVYVGKNEILLTTVKFPPNLNLFHDSLKALRSLLSLPNGVHLILLPDGSISYKIDQNIEVNAIEMANMPAIIAVVQAHMETLGAQEETQKKQKDPLATAATASEVVDLVDDDDESSSYANENQNTETPLVPEDKASEKSDTINSDDSLDVSNNSKIDTSKNFEVNPADENVNSNVTNIDTKSNQNNTVDQSTVTDIQDIQDSRQNNIVSASTEHNKPKSLSQPESSDVHVVSTEQIQDQSERSDQNVVIQEQDCSEATTQNVSIMVPEERRSEHNRPKTKNILSDLMEMSGIFDEDMTPEVEDKVSAQPAEASSMTLETTETSSVPPKVSSRVGELTPITSLYELKYACANNGVFFKLNFETGYLVPINVCMKPTSLAPIPRLAPKSVIDLTDDDDKNEPDGKGLDIAQKDKQLDISSMKRSHFLGPVKPIKLFKALKPNILQQLNLNKKIKNRMTPLYDRTTLDHNIKRKQFLKSINMNADLSVFSSLKRHTRKSKVAGETVNEPTATSRSKPVKEFATTILSDDDSSDDEPLAKIAKRKNENSSTSESGTKNIELETSVEKLIESDVPVVDDVINMNEDDLVEGEAPLEEQNDSELPIDATEPVFMSDDDNDFMDQDAPFGFDDNESNEEEDTCILGV